ncbi:MAG: N-acetylmuramoyl-L-alanine amidase [Candidatus Latescibacteria bacterium]|nr:N-acetylmuramoyl-L-alanine amidase [Candidatus Latescibacterota bacterium]
MKAPADETAAARLEVSPGKSDGVYQVLRRYGLAADRKRYLLFRDMNAALMRNGDALHLDLSYKLPIFVVPLDRPLDSILGDYGVAAFRKKIVAYNRSHNPSFLIGSTNGRPGWTVWIPEKRSGFYDTGDSGAPSARPGKNESARPPDEGGINTVDPALALPYPKIKDSIAQGSVSGKLSKFCFVLDPGHGGNDPGTIPTVLRGDGLNTRAVEAPLVYDVTLRLMRHIMLNGGTVFLTHYSPEFGIKDVKNPREFRNQRYNISSLDIRTDTPAQSIRERKRIAGAVIKRKYNRGKKVVFISIHADYLSSSNDKPITVFYHRLTRLDGGRSRAFARKLAKALTGSSKNSKPKGLGVLYKNPSHLEVLIELVNLNNIRGAWRLRDFSYRERLAKTLTKGLVKALN